ncbi:MAG: DUF177 domain-containing protein [Cyanobacteriota bacterium]|nr:DUF177 domain-containing protein [Cyanobacteriota bacterium]
MKPVAVQDLLAADGPLHWQFEQPIRGLASTGPVRGVITACVEGPLLRVQGEAETTVQLRCDRCLNVFDYPLKARANECIGLGQGEDALAEALDFDAEGISEQLDPSGSFDPEQWIYEQLNLQLPLVNRCGAHCPGPATWGSRDPVVDPRWAALKNLQP